VTTEYPELTRKFFESLNVPVQLFHSFGASEAKVPDLMDVVVDLTVLYKVIPTEAPRILKEVGTDYRNVIVRPICRTGIRDNAVYYDAVSLFSSKGKNSRIVFLKLLNPGSGSGVLCLNSSS
jgi:regulator of protease activity HflC (stomatin/prohibitin superfamily)